MMVREKFSVSKMEVGPGGRQIQVEDPIELFEHAQG